MRRTAHIKSVAMCEWDITGKVHQSFEVVNHESIYFFRQHVIRPEYAFRVVRIKYNVAPTHRFHITHVNACLAAKCETTFTGDKLYAVVGF